MWHIQILGKVRGHLAAHTDFWEGRRPSCGVGNYKFGAGRECQNEKSPYIIYFVKKRYNLQAWCWQAAATCTDMCFVLLRSFAISKHFGATLVSIWSPKWGVVTGVGGSAAAARTVAE